MRHAHVAENRHWGHLESRGCRFRRESAMDMTGMMGQVHDVLHQLMAWFHQMSGMPMMDMMNMAM